MSLLWADAAAAQLVQRTAAWWNNQGDHDYEGEGEYAIRPPGEAMSQRRQRYVSQIVDRHNVSRKRATEALRHVHGHLRAGSVWVNPTDYGFASANRTHNEHYTPNTYRKLQDPATWRGRPVEQVPTDEIHASQDFIRPESVAHNLFWPGHREPEDTEATGDPDWEPESEHEREDLGHETPEDRELHRTAKFIQYRGGKIECVDGHHRVGTDLILGKKTTPGQMIHERDLEDRNPSIRELPHPANLQAHRQHLADEHGYSEEAIHHLGLGTKPIVEHDFDHQDHQDELDHEHPED